MSEEKTYTVAELDDQLETLKIAIGNAAIEGGDVGSLAEQFVVAQNLRKTTFVAENADAINSEKSSVKAAIGALISTSQLEALMGEPVTMVVYQLVKGDGDEVTPNLFINPTKATGKRKAGGGGGRGGSVKFVDADGNEYNARQIRDTYANDEERAHSHFIKWPSKVAEEKILPRLQEQNAAWKVVKGAAKPKAEEAPAEEAAADES